MNNKDLANLIFPNITKTIEDYEKEYSKRNLSEGACVTRFAPSPTGYMHIGGFYQAIIDYIKRNNIKDAGIITPFKNQQVLINNLLKDLGL